MSSSGDSVMPPLLHYWARLQVQTGSPFSDLWTGLGPGVPQVLNTWCHPGIIILWGLPRNWVRQVECTQGFQFTVTAGVICTITARGISELEKNLPMRKQRSEALNRVVHQTQV